MSWLTNIVRPGLKTPTKRGVSAEVWEKCPGCGQLIYEADLPASLSTCPGCGYHLPWGITERLTHLMDEGATPIPVSMPKDDPLHFKDKKKYKDRLKAARDESGHADAFRVLKGSIGGQRVVVAALDFAFMAGSMSRGVGEAIVATATEAQKEKCALLCITASGGARMQEGTLSLMQMARTTAAIANVKDAKLPYLTLLCNPTTGGVTASFAMLGTVTLAEPGALIGFAGPRVIAQTIGGTLPDGFQKAEYLLDHGMVDAILPRKDQKQTITRLLTLLSANATPPSHHP
jgi:acetyl-CoA carboxylase carboxyl transferase subunit beta